MYLVKVDKRKDGKYTYNYVIEGSSRVVDRYTLMLDMYYYNNKAGNIFVVNYDLTNSDNTSTLDLVKVPIKIAIDKDLKPKHSDTASKLLIELKKNLCGENCKYLNYLHDSDIHNLSALVREAHTKFNSEINKLIDSLFGDINTQIENFANDIKSGKITEGKIIKNRESFIHSMISKVDANMDKYRHYRSDIIFNSKYIGELEFSYISRINIDVETIIKNGRNKFTRSVEDLKNLVEYKRIMGLESKHKFEKLVSKYIDKAYKLSQNMFDILNQDNNTYELIAREFIKKIVADLGDYDLDTISLKDDVHFKFSGELLDIINKHTNGFYFSYGINKHIREIRDNTDSTYTVYKLNIPGRKIDDGDYSYAYKKVDRTIAAKTDGNVSVLIYKEYTKVYSYHGLMNDWCSDLVYMLRDGDNVFVLDSGYDNDLYNGTTFYKLSLDCANYSHIKDLIIAEFNNSSKISKKALLTYLRFFDMDDYDIDQIYKTKQAKNRQI